jgi:hypothetical protein
MKTRVRCLNDAGIQKFCAWLADPQDNPPTEMLDNPTYCDELSKEFWVDSTKVFETSFALGKYLHEEVFFNVSDPAGHSALTGMWAWISLRFITSLLSKGASRKNKPLDFPHYLELPTQQGRRLGYRLIARTAWRLVRQHGDLAEVALGSKRSPWGEMAEQMTSRQEIFSHPSFWAVAFRLYRNSKGELRRGATSQRPASARKDPKNKAGKGGVRRLPFTFRQFDRTYLTRAMSLNQMLDVLPKEYQRWIAES